MPRSVNVAVASALLGAALAVATPAQAVVGGKPVSASASPWLADLPFCGGALIAPDRVATAAHCVAGLPVRTIGRIRFGDGQVRQATGVAIEPRYVRRALEGTGTPDAPADDVAIVLLDRPVDGTRPLALRARQPRSGTRAVLLGRGQTSVPRRVVRSAQAPPLRRTTLEVLSDTACRSFYRRHGGRTYRSSVRGASMVCATDPDGRRPFRSACVGDSGGPLVVGSTLAGIVSWGLRCGGDLDPTVFTDPSAYRSFLTAPAPVLAPEASETPATMTGTPAVGQTLTCAAPPWVRQPDHVTFSWSSYRYQRGRITRQRGASPTYVVRAADAGRFVSCVATGWTAGGYESAPPSASVRIPAT